MFVIMNKFIKFCFSVILGVIAFYFVIGLVFLIVSVIVALFM